MLNTNFSKTVAAFLFLTFLSCPGAADAAFSFNAKEPEPEKPDTELDLTGSDSIVLAQIGPGEKEKKQSRGDDVRLPLAIELITPDGWEGIVEESSEDKTVSWQGDSEGDWMKTLEKVGRDEGIRFVVNWEAKQIAAGRGEIEDLAKETDTSNTAEVKDGEKGDHVTSLEAEDESLEAEEVEEGESGQDAVNVSDAPWELEPGSLKDQLAEWCERVEYELIWDSKYDYQIEASQTFYGDFKEAVKETVTALYRSGARITADIYTKNNVLYISGSSEE